MQRSAIALIAALLVVTACGSDSIVIDVADDATFCSVFDGEYRSALNAAVPITDAAFAERTGEIVAWAEVLVDLAPAEIASEATDNLEYHRAQAAVESAADHIPGSNAMHQWGNENC
jgi:hypothetical protein